jgi:hypothetical protein
MKNHNYNRQFVFIFLLTVFSLCSCSIRKWTVPTELVGQWKSDLANITVRTEPKWMRFEFTSNSGFVIFTIDSNKTASGFIGSAEFKNGKVKKNSGNPDKTGVAYIIQCGSIGEIFSNDPLRYKKVEIWLGPLKGEMHATLRFTEGGAMFPMADLKIRKANAK